MSAANLLVDSFVSINASAAYSQATVVLCDGSTLYFCHRVDQRWARAEGTGGEPDDASIAAHVLARIRLFRLNAKHLDIQFDDGGRWEHVFAPRRV